MDFLHVNIWCQAREYQLAPSKGIKQWHYKHTVIASSLMSGNPKNGCFFYLIICSYDTLYSFRNATMTMTILLLFARWSTQIIISSRHPATIPNPKRYSACLACMLYEVNCGQHRQIRCTRTGYARSAFGATLPLRVSSEAHHSGRKINSGAIPILPAVK